MLIRRGKLSIFFLLSSLAFAGGTRTWEQSQFEELAKGTTDNVAIRSEGGVELAPTFKAVLTTPSAYIWSIATDQSGSLYAGAGTPARVYRIASNGKSSVIFQSQELQVQAIAIGSSGELYAATNPDGKVYRLSAGTIGRKKSGKGVNATELDATWNSEVYFDPGAKYIWDLALDKSGNLFIATGGKGEIFRVTPNGEHTLFFKSDEAHIRVLAFDNAGDLIAGSDGSGLIYRISPDGNGLVLYSAPKKEITALAVDAHGNIYAAGAGEKRSSSGLLPAISIPSSGSAPGSNISSTNSPIGFSLGSGGSITSVPSSPSGPGGAGGSEIYRISPDGAPSRIWNSRDDLVYCLVFDQDGKLLAGSGNRGHIFRIRGKDLFTDLLKASASQVTAFSHSSGNGIYAASSNLGKIFLLGAGPATEGTYSSDVLDAHIFSRWGRAELRGTGNVDLYARSGNVDNPDRNWSAWEKIDWLKDPEIRVPPARFIQWKTVLHAGAPAAQVESVTVNYLSKNVPPEFDEVTVQDGIRYPANQKSSSDGGSRDPQRVENLPSPSHERGSIGVKWSVHDDNDDDMVYSIYYRGEHESRWLLLKDNLADKFYSFDSSLLPDGAYTIKVVASDAPSHSPGEALTAEKQSGRFEIDTTSPRIEGLRASIEGSGIHLSFTASDAFSPIQRAEISLDAGDFQYVEPVNKISDSKTERYDFRIALASDVNPSEHVIVIRAYDRHDNMASAKTVISMK